MPTALAAANAHAGPLFWLVGIGIGLVLPAVIQIGDMLRRVPEHRVSVPLAAITAILILVGGFVFRYAIVIGGQLS